MFLILWCGQKLHFLQLCQRKHKFLASYPGAFWRIGERLDHSIMGKASTLPSALCINAKPWFIARYSRSKSRVPFSQHT